ncbi:MAG: hypothetical protein FJ009_04170 [Chloroflexi bacterium]|nr:hypothetical protein [Chloroflexota bacterium]
MDNPNPSALEINPGFNFSGVRALLLLVGVIALLGMMYLTQNSQAAMTGTRTLELQDRLERLRRENAQLEYEIAVLTTPDKIAERARRLGLRPATITQTVFIAINNYPAASKPASPATLAPTKSAAPMELLWNELLARLGLLSSGRTVEASP